MTRAELVLALAAAMVCSSITGCNARLRARPGTVRVQTRVTAPPPPRVVATAGGGGLNVRVTTPMGSAGITVLDSYCQAGQPEVCNGLDDNCNGVIDEGCGYNTGNIQITLAWNTGADLDMYVTDPAGYTISYQNPRSPTGAHLDHDARGDCNRRQANNTIENVYWDAPNPPRGQYQVEVHYWGDCDTAGTTQATLSIAVAGQVIGAYNVVLNPRERQPVASFNMP